MSLCKITFLTLWSFIIWLQFDLEVHNETFFLPTKAEKTVLLIVPLIESKLFLLIHQKCFASFTRLIHHTKLKKYFVDFEKYNRIIPNLWTTNYDRKFKKFLQELIKFSKAYILEIERAITLFPHILRLLLENSIFPYWKTSATYTIISLFRYG